MIYAWIKIHNHSMQNSYFKEPSWSFLFYFFTRLWLVLLVIVFILYFGIKGTHTRVGDALTQPFFSFSCACIRELYSGFFCSNLFRSIVNFSSGNTRYPHPINPFNLAISILTVNCPKLWLSPPFLRVLSVPHRKCTTWPSDSKIKWGSQCQAIYEISISLMP